MPEQACELYVAVYNQISGDLAASADLDDTEISRRAHDAAMLQVKNEFEVHAGGRWHRAPIAEDMQRLGPAADDEAKQVLKARRDAPSD
jgi:hypothetical protein